MWYRPANAEHVAVGFGHVQAKMVIAFLMGLYNKHNTRLGASARQLLVGRGPTRQLCGGNFNCYRSQFNMHNRYTNQAQSEKPSACHKL